MAKNHSKLVLLFSIALLSFLSVSAARALNSKVYIVYLGEREHDDPELVTDSHHQMLQSLVGSKEDAHRSMIYSYRHGFSGFAALLTSSQAKKISEHPKVVRVIPNRILKLKTTRTWDQIGLSSSSLSVKGLLHDTNMGSKAIIGILDTGVWPESKVFNDQGLGPIPKRWRGRCESGEKFNATIHCNNKLIGAKYYLNGLLADVGGKFNKSFFHDFKSNRDAHGHGTHTATIAAGSFVPNASFYGLAQGTVRGGAPRARIASYKVCWKTMGGDCSSADISKAFDDAIHDGVDVLSLSLGDKIPEDSEVDSLDDIGAFHAVAKGITVVSAAGNDGPTAQTVDNVAPWVLTVAATTVDRSFASKITLGNRQTFLAESLFSGREISTGLAYVNADSEHTVDKGKTLLVFDNAAPNAGEGVAGHILDNAAPNGGKDVGGLILAMQPDDALIRFDATARVYVDYEIGTEILKYIRTTRSPTVIISAARTLTGLPATTKIAAFSSRGPNSLSSAILKPDIAAPGACILAGLSPLNPTSHNGFGLLSGTSMSTPVVSGVVALLKSLHPKWSPAAYRSALVTTAWRTSPSGEPIFAQGSNMKLADPFGGLINPQKAAEPGLIYDMGTQDYTNYMCWAGYNDSSISRVLGKATTCPTPKPSILDINLPSITVPNLEQEVTITRRVTNVGPISSTYQAVIESPLGVTLAVNPSRLVFNSTAKRLTFWVKAKTSHQVNTGYLFGSLTWTDSVHDVRIPVSVRTTITIKP